MVKLIEELIKCLYGFCDKSHIKKYSLYPLFSMYPVNM